MHCKVAERKKGDLDLKCVKHIQEMSCYIYMPELMVPQREAAQEYTTEINK